MLYNNYEKLIVKEGEYFMKTMFIEKLKTKSFFIGSFDCFEEQTKTLIIKNSKLTEDKVKDKLYKKMKKILVSHQDTEK